MKSPSRAIKLCGTEQPDVVGRILHAGPMQVEFNNGQLRYLKVGGVEVLRAVGFLVRDENWGTYTPLIRELRIDQRSDGFSLSFDALCSRPDQEVGARQRLAGEDECASGVRFDGGVVGDRKSVV